MKRYRKSCSESQVKRQQSRNAYKTKNRNNLRGRPIPRSPLRFFLLERGNRGLDQQFFSPFTFLTEKMAISTNYFLPLIVYLVLHEATFLLLGSIAWGKIKGRKKCSFLSQCNAGLDREECWSSFTRLDSWKEETLIKRTKSPPGAWCSLLLKVWRRGKVQGVAIRPLGWENQWNKCESFSSERKTKKKQALRTSAITHPQCWNVYCPLG